MSNTITGSLIDLTNIGLVCNWLNVATSSADADTLQTEITAASQFIYDECGRDYGFDTEGNFTAGMFNAQTTYTEIIDGNGHIRIFPRNAPVLSITSLIAGTYSYSASTGLNQPGYFVEQNKRSIALRQGTGSGTFSFNNIINGLRFPHGTGNIQLIYVAGFIQTPADLEEGCRILTSLEWFRKNRPDLAAEMQADAGTTSYRGDPIPKKVQQIIDKYKRRALV